MNPIAQKLAMSIVRKALVMAGTYIIATGAVSESDWLNQVAGLTPIIVGAGWSLYLRFAEARK